MGIKKALLTAVIAVCAILLNGCAGMISETMETLVSPNESYKKADRSGDYSVQDSDALYRREDDHVLTLYMTVGRGNDKDGTNYTWEQVNARPLSYYETWGIEPYMCEAVVQFGDELGPVAGEFGYGELTPNATVRLRGAGASEQQQKSYRIDIKQNKGEWENQQAIILNKHAADPTKLRNRLAYALMADIPTMFSARTWYVHLYVKDKTQPGDNLFHDYGLYTAVEQINSRYLRNRGLESSGSLYKAVDFDWRQHADVLRAATNANFDQKAFEQVLEIKGSVDHAKLIELLRVVNDESVPISQTVETYFDEDNLYYWMAFHMLMGNRSAANSNYYLYSPQVQNKWYFLSWDNDAMLNDAYERLRDSTYDPSWNHGIFMFSQVKLFERILKDEECRAGFDNAVEDLMDSHLTRETLEEKIRTFQSMSRELVYSLPDSAYQRVAIDEYERLVAGMVAEIDQNYDAYQSSLDEPWPFHILKPSAVEGGLTLQWEPSYVYPSGTPVYSVELARSPDFSQCIVKETAYAGTAYNQPALPAGQYFLRVRAKYGENWQDACEYYITENAGTVYSTMCFYVLEDGSVEVLQYVEE